MLHRREAMGNNDRCNAAMQITDYLGDPVFGLVIQGRGRFVEHQHVGIAVKSLAQCRRAVSAPDSWVPAEPTKA